MSINITMKSALDAMCQIVGEYGVDHVYVKVDGSCVNWDVDRDCPSCLIGQVMHRLGIDGAFLSERFSANADDLVSYIRRDIEGSQVEGGVATILIEAQKKQDNGHPWGDALAAALSEYRDIMQPRARAANLLPASNLKSLD